MEELVSTQTFEESDGVVREKQLKCELIRDNFQNFKRYNIPKAQLIIADIPYNLGNNAYASSPQWYKDGDNKNGESEFANKQFFNTDKSFNIAEFFHFSSKLLRKEPKGTNEAPAMIVFCAFEQMHEVIECGKKHGFKHSYPLFFVKKSSPQVLKANMKILGATEHAVVLYRDKLPKFRNGAQRNEDGTAIRGTGKMIKNWFEWEKDGKEVHKVHKTQKPVKVLKRLIEIFTDEGDVVIDPVAGSGSTLRASREMGRNSYGFEIDKNFYQDAIEKVLLIEEEYKIGVDMNGMD